MWLRHSTTKVVGSACIVWAPSAHGCSVFVLSREVTGLVVFSLVKLRLVVRSLCPLRYGGRSVLRPNHAPTPSVDGVNICVYQLVVEKKTDRGVDVHHSPTQVGAPLLSRLWVLHKAWAEESDSLQTCLLSPPWFHVTWRSCTDWFFPASFPAVVGVGTYHLWGCSGHKCSSAVGEREGEARCESSSLYPVSGLEKIFGGLGAAVHPEASCSWDRRPTTPWCCCCQPFVLEAGGLKCFSKEVGHPEGQKIHSPPCLSHPS